MKNFKMSLKEYRLGLSGLMWLGILFLDWQGMLWAQESSDWPRFRGPTGQGVSAAKGLPLTWSFRENVVWKTALPGPGASSPVIVGERIFVTCFSGYGVPGQPRGDMDQLKLHVVCLDRDSGKILWTRDLAPKLPEQATMRDSHGYASSSPAADAGAVYAFFGKSGAVALDHDGKQLWQADLGAGMSGFGSGASVMLYRDLAIFNASIESQSLVALDKKTGKEVWRATGIRESYNAPVLVPLKDGTTELVVAMMGKVLGFDPATGKSLWSCNNEIGWYIVPSVVAQDETIWSLGGRSGVVAVALKAGGRGDVTQTHRLWTSRKGANVCSPIYHDGHLYWMQEELGIACCADAKTGNMVYEERIPGAGQVYASPLLAGGKLYYVNRAGRTYILPAAPRFEVLHVNDLADASRFSASPAVAGDRLFLRSEKHLYCLGKN